MIETLPAQEQPATTLARCPKGQRLFKGWTNRIRSATYDNWQTAFFHPTRYGYDTHLNKCETCRAYDQKYKRST